MDRPLKTLGAAILLAQEGPGRVYACAEAYAEAVSLPAGVSLYGGYACDGSWQYGTTTRAKIVPNIPGVALALTEGEGVSIVRDVDVTALSATEPGASSVAVFAYPGSKADIGRAYITAGKGADGRDGDDGKHDGVSPKQGMSGIDGAAVCTMKPGLGGAAVVLECEGGFTSASGAAGNGGEQFANDGNDGMVAPEPNPAGYGEGGKGESSDGLQLCTPGYGGVQGADGENGVGALGQGRLTLEGYQGPAGGDGQRGFPGQGGGGGGGSRGSASCGAAPHGGAGGGSGGTGGCGGRPGIGGQAGGSSIGVVVLSDAIRLDAVRIHADDGGDGGNGGVGQAGAQGGLPGLGGASVDGIDVHPGCAGGAGGYGGRGGHGAGGHGGHSVAFAYTLANAPHLGNVVVPEWGLPGNAGVGGDPHSIAALGQMGFANQNLVLDP